VLKSLSSPLNTQWHQQNICCAYNNIIVYFRVDREKAQLKNEIGDLQDQLANASKKGVSSYILYGDLLFVFNVVNYKFLP